VPPDNVFRGSPREWLARAHSDLIIARIPLPSGGRLEDLCYHAQQAAEKAIKAVYVHHGWEFPYVHDLEELLRGLRANGLSTPDALHPAAKLTPYAKQTRYPGPAEPVAEQERDLAVKLAEAVVSWAERVIVEARR
jgi:HEPN domain-containing protein